MIVERASTADIASIMEIERMPGFEALVGRWSEERHLQALSDPKYAYFMARTDEGAAGFAIIREWNSQERVSLIKRIAVKEPGRGHGTIVLREVINQVFEKTAAYRLWIGVFPDNLRARKAYESAGFAAEGIARGSAYFGGEYRDELYLGMLRPEWEARKVAP
jgi:RimJ/RimL family protein N-acetyltransferase